MQKITPCLWFDDNAEQAINFYMSLFKDSKIININRDDKGNFFVGTFELNGQQFLALNGGPMFKFTEAISLSVSCEDQAEVDMYWEKLSAGGEKSQCGWLKDKFGLSWQVVPKQISEYMSDADPAKAKRVMAAVMKMTKLDVAEIEKAAAGK